MVDNRSNIELKYIKRVVIKYGFVDIGAYGVRTRAPLVVDRKTFIHNILV